ncbi:DUF3667 domain-containing protein [Brevundimonas sp.]|uniref:DUF3667 domain-containing protein n=1 Tax=Brevundimonas sp. TaxID=1871086 RepID=UPI001DA5810B|nr:DUF3667 domain-containing protein [Brevundimonas sp.]MBA3999199.1 hypothetical protein [Brevundimonas sp.]
MTNELETAAAASAGGWLRFRRRQADIPPGTPCANCETPLVGTYCHACGQLAEDFHKSFWKLGKEALESFFHLDGRLARTLPQLILRPGRLTRDYLDGKRAFQVPPLRMFLVILLLTFVVGQCALNRGSADEFVGQAGASAADPRSALDQARAEIAADESMTEEEKRIAEAALERNWGGLVAGITAAREADQIVEQQATDPADSENLTAFRAWVNERAEGMRAEPRRFSLLLAVWAQRVVMLLLPVSALILACMFFWRREVFLFDHLIFSMHSLSFQLLLITTTFLLAMGIGPVAWSLLWLSPVHLFVHMRGAYASNTAMTLLRMFVLFTATTIAGSFMLLLWLFLAFNEMAS